MHSYVCCGYSVHVIAAVVSIATLLGWYPSLSISMPPIFTAIKTNLFSPLPSTLNMKHYINIIIATYNASYSLTQIMAQCRSTKTYSCIDSFKILILFFIRQTLLVSYIVTFYNVLTSVTISVGWQSPNLFGACYSLTEMAVPSSHPPAHTHRNIPTVPNCHHQVIKHVPIKNLIAAVRAWQPVLVPVICQHMQCL